MLAGDGRGSLRRGLDQRKLAVHNHKGNNTKNVSHLSWLSLIPTRGGHNTCKPASVYAPQSVPDTYGVVSSPTFKCPPRHVHHADRSVSRILTAQFPHGVQAFAAYRLPVSRMLARCCRHTHQRQAGYNSAPRLIRTRRIPDARIMPLRFHTDACSFVRPCLRGSAYVSYRRSASYFTAGEGCCPFEPRKGKRQERQ